MSYQTSNEEKDIEIVNVAGLEEEVRPRMEAGAFGYIRGGAETEWTMKENTAARYFLCGSFHETLGH